MRFRPIIRPSLASLRTLVSYRRYRGYTPNGAWASARQYRATFPERSIGPLTLRAEYGLRRVPNIHLAENCSVGRETTIAAVPVIVNRKEMPERCGGIPPIWSLFQELRDAVAG